ncbi:hypothetical protein PH5382_00228 [Phaeobacter sp. CECT 5382]|uniref:hypothetical protein n=1 Tax=Phaeobacter sp. CECT 5382 TaxID=1712645 RepID=UPI0006DA7F09|nr:hypothetical protein [Phaeobacter sp. CECT 5382]CUH86319.1 hypothetical protein PH5382_00228 [Phaeobacter sp. CECT 5382]
MRRAGIIACLAGLSACAGPSYEVIGAYHDRAASDRSSNQSPNHATDDPRGETRYETPDERLQAVAFEHLQGMSRSDALSFLQSDGFQCQGVTCVHSSQKKLGAAEAIFGASTADDRVFSDRRTSVQSYSLSLVSDVIMEPGDIYADAVFRSGQVPWYRSPRPSDLEVTHD